MFLSTSKLNEGAYSGDCPENSKELLEGKKPNSEKTNWNVGASTLHSNANWQKLRK